MLVALCFNKHMSWPELEGILCSIYCDQYESISVSPVVCMVPFGYCRQDYPGRCPGG